MPIKTDSYNKIERNFKLLDIKKRGDAMESSYLIKPLLDAQYPVIQYGKGIFLYDNTGKKYLDASSGAVTANIGHGVPEIIDAMLNQAKKVSFVYRSQFTSDAAEALAAKISSLAIGDLNWSFFVNSGSEAVETAMKIAIQYWQEKGKGTKTKILIKVGQLSWYNNWCTFSCPVILAEDPDLFRSLKTAPPFTRHIATAVHMDALPLNAGTLCAQELETVIKRTGADRIAAFIAEPVIGAAGGAITPPKGYFKVIKDICERNEILFIADEVMTGFGRTGTVLACEHWDIKPDIAALGKGMGAGYAVIAATLVSDKIMEPILKGSKLIMSGHTLSANPQSCAVSLAVLQYLEQHQIIPQVEAKGIFLKNSLRKIAQPFFFYWGYKREGLASWNRVC